MKNKFLNGARVAGVMLALILLGTSGAWAAPKTVEVNLANLGVTKGNASQTQFTVAEQTAAGWTLTEADRFGVWRNGNDVGDDIVTAKFTKSTGTNPASYYDSVLIIEAKANVEKIIVRGALSKTLTGDKGIRVKQIVFQSLRPAASGGTVVEWDGGDVVGVKAKTGNGSEPNPANVDAFIVKGGTEANLTGIHLFSGKIEAWSKFIIKDVGAKAGGDLSLAANETARNASNLIGNWSSAKANDSLRLTAHGTAAVEVSQGALAVTAPPATVTPEKISINPPNKGNYTIESDSLAIVAKEGQEWVIIGKTSDHGSGTLKIVGWKNISTAAASATAGAAVKAPNVKVNGSNTKTSKLIVINGKGKFVISAEGQLNLTDVEIQHAAPANTEGAAALSTNGEVKLTAVSVTNGTTSGNVSGLLVSTKGAITVLNGTFFPTANPKGGTALSTVGNVDITGAKFASNAAANAAGYVIESGNGTVTLKTTSTDSVVIDAKATGFAVGGVSARYVNVINKFGTKAEIRTQGNGAGIYVKLDGVNNTAANNEVVHVEGNASASVNINTVLGQAIFVEDKSALEAVSHVNVTIQDANIVRTGAAATTPLVEVQNGNVWVYGTTTDRMRLIAAANLALSASINNTRFKAGLADDGGEIVIDGGNITGSAVGAVRGQKVNIQQWNYTEGVLPLKLDNYGRMNTVISSAGGVTVESVQPVVINNGYASIFHSGTALDVATGNANRAAAVYSLLGSISVLNVDSIRTFNATTLLTVTPGSQVNVAAGKIRSTASYAINTAGSVDVDWWSVCEDGNANGNPRCGEGEDAIAGDQVGAKHNKIEISTNGSGASVTAIYAPFPDESGYNVHIGEGRVVASGTGGSAAIVVNKGNVTVDHKDAWVYSASGNGVKVQDANVTLNFGDIVSNPSSGNFAAIWVVNGDVSVGEAEIPAGQPGDIRANVTSNGALAVYLDGLGAKKVTVGFYGVLTVKGANATAGMIRVTKDNFVVINPNAHLISTGAQAFAIEADDGNVYINGGKIVSQKSKQAISTKGGEIYITGHAVGSLDRDIDGGVVGTRITGEEGILVRSIKSARTGRAGGVFVSGGFIYNKYGTGIRADDSLKISGGEIVTDKDTAVVAGTATTAGLVEIGYPAHIWAAAQYTKATPVAVASRMIRMHGGLVEANTIKSSADNTSTYPDSKATGLLLKKGPGEPVFKVGSVNGEVSGQIKIIAHGANTAIDCQDSTVTLEIVAPEEVAGALDSFRISVNGDNLGSEILWLPGSVTIKAGDNGIAIKSVGEIKVAGQTITEESRGEDGLNVGVYIATGNGVNARAIVMPVPANSNKHKDLTLYRGFVEAGSDGAVALDATSKAIIRVGESVILARHLSTAINGQGGVYIDSSYVEILATENNNVGTAVTGRNIRISGGKADDATRSEIHSKGIAVKDAVESAVVQVTGHVHMSGTVSTNMKVGSSVVGDEADLTMGSEASRRLYRLSTFSEKTDLDEDGKAMIIPAGVTVEVGDNGSGLGTEKFDTLKIAGRVTTVGRQAGAKFRNSGRVLVEKGGNVLFNKADPESFKNDEGIIVLKTGALLDDSVLVHDTGKYSERKYTFLKWAKILSGDSVLSIGSRGPGNVVVPPMYATLYGNQRLFVDEEDMDETGLDYWTATSSRSDSVYTAKFIKYPLDLRYKPYFETEDFLAKGDFLLGGTGTVKVDEDGTVLLTEAGTFNRVAVMTNEAGEGTKTYTHVVNKVDFNRITQNQTEGPIFFDGYFYNKNRRVVGRDGEDTVLVREGGVEVKYTGNTAKLLDGILGVEVEGFTDLATDKPVYYSGLGEWTFWYRGVDDTYYPLTSNVPTNVGSYEVLASFTAGNNFEAVPADERSIVPIGTVTVVEGDIESVFGKKDNESYQLLVDLEAKIAKSGVKAVLPSVIRFGAVYDNENIEISGPGDAALVGVPTLPDSILTFNVNANSKVGDYIEFKVTILNTAEPANLVEGQYITIRVRFLSKEDMKEAKPSYITVNYRSEQLSGLLVGTTYTINGESLLATSANVPIKEDWVGTTLSVVALPGANSYKTQSDVAQIVIGTRPAVNDSLRKVEGDDASTAIAIDGRLRNTSTSMEYKLQADTTWKPASAVVTTGLKAGVYEVRLAPTTSSFPSAAVTVTIGARDGVVEAAREIPKANATAEAAIAPVARVTATFTAGPSPVSKNAGKVSFFSSKAVKSGSLYIFDASGNTVAKVKAKSGSKEIASWNLKDKKGAVVATGSYVVKGKLVGKDGKAETVSAIFSVAK